jgi:hypothetical protein
MPFQLGLVGSDGGLMLEGDPPDVDAMRRRPGVGLQSVTPGYFRAMGISLVEGRVFDDRDDADAPGVVLVGESVARQLWPGDTALGKRVVVSGAAPPSSTGETPWQTIIGVVADTRHREIASDGLDVYVPFAQIPIVLRHVVVRTESDPLVLSVALREAVGAVDPVQRVGPVVTLDALVSSTQRPWQFNMVLAAALGAVGMVLAAVALFGTVAYGVGQRTREIGVRRALGATSAHVLGVVSRGALGAALGGAGIGAGGAWLVSRLLHQYQGPVVLRADLPPGLTQRLDGFRIR